MGWFRAWLAYYLLAGLLYGIGEVLQFRPLMFLAVVYYENSSEAREITGSLLPLLLASPLLLLVLRSRKKRACSR